MSFRLFEKYRTEFFATVIAIIMIIAGLYIPTIIPDQLTRAPPGFEDTTWIKTLIAVILIGMGLLCFIWLVVIHRFIARKSKKDYMY
ncbi:MAG: hypothetical protein ACFE9L_15805 [Candidatus Hodarchaeota archaeon]